MLDIAANLADIIAGLAIVIAAIRAWPIFTNVEQRLARSADDKKLVAADIDRFIEGLKQHFEIDPVSRDPADLVKQLLTFLPQGASDVHIEINPARAPYPARISYSQLRLGEQDARCDVAYLGMPGHRKLIDTLKQLADQDGQDRDRGFITVDDARFLLTTARSINGEVATLRAIPSEPLKVERLGLNDYPHWPLIERFLTEPDPGALVIAGPLGSGKATTAAALVEYLTRTDATKVVSLEYPVAEFIVNGVTQITCDSADEIDHNYALARGQRPDVLVLSLAERGGRYIWDAYGREFGLREMAFVTAFDAAAALETINRQVGENIKSIDAPFYILGQNLQARLCKDCRRPVALTEEDRRIIDAIKTDHAACTEAMTTGDTWYEPVGCENCQGGYLGRIALIEILEVTQDMLDLGRVGSRVLRQAAIANGMASLQLHALSLASEGEIAFSDLQRLSREHGYSASW